MLTAACMFSCIGHHGIGLHRAGIRTVSLCENVPERQEVLRRMFPGVEVHDEAETYKPPRADILIGGPPCKNTSIAAAVHGYRTNVSLWPTMFRHIMGFKWLVVEQPPGNKAWESQVSHDVTSAGWHIARFEFSASDLGAPYIRRRVFLVACPSLPRLESAWVSVPKEIVRVKRSAADRGDWSADKLEFIPLGTRASGEFRSEKSHWRRKMIEALGDSNPPHMAEVIGRAIVKAERVQ